MGREQSFLDRIANLTGGRSSGQTTNEDIEALARSVREHLGRLLNARHGMSEALPDYGLPSLLDLTMGSGEYVQAVRDAIRTSIEKYEPRLRRVRVSQVQEEDVSTQKLKFVIDAVLVTESGEQRVWYETAINRVGEFDVAG